MLKKPLFLLNHVVFIIDKANKSFIFEAMDDKNNRKAEVKSFFEQTDIYFNFDYNIRLRSEIVKEFIGDKSFKNVLDMPCGNGYISLKNSSQFEKLTLVDFSENMIMLAEDIAKKENVSNATFICKDIFDTSFQEGEFDLIISLGILAHVNNIEDFLNFIQSKVKKGGSIIIQNTNSQHFYSWLIKLYLGVRKLIGKDKYTLNKVPAKLVEQHFKKAGFSLNKIYRYNQSFIGFSRLFSNEKKYQLTRKWFGNVDNNTKSSLGSDYIYLFTKD